MTTDEQMALMAKARDSIMFWWSVVIGIVILRWLLR
jgi:hypothetical protein